MSARPEREVAEEIGRAAIDAADKLRAFMPEMQARVEFTLEDTPFVAIIRLKRS